jgi:hypothetical protein
MANLQSSFSIISFSVVNNFFLYVGIILISFHNGNSVCIILCIVCRPVHCVVTTYVNLPVYIHIVMAERKCSINDSIKSVSVYERYE